MTINTNSYGWDYPSFIVKSQLASNSIRIIAPYLALVKRKMVTHTGFEPMLTA